MTNKLLCQLYETSISLTEIIEQMSIDSDMLDSQEYLDWKDSINTLSLDPDRPDVV